MQSFETLILLLAHEPNLHYQQFDCAAVVHTHTHTHKHVSVHDVLRHMHIHACCMHAGLKLSQCDFVAVNNGITVTKSCLQLNVINNHINARVACINGREINQSCIMGNLFYKDPSSETHTVGVQIAGNSAWNIIANNVSSSCHCPCLFSKTLCDCWLPAKRYVIVGYQQ